MTKNGMQGIRTTGPALAGSLLLAAVAGGQLGWGQVGFGPGERMDPAEALKTAQASEAPEAPGFVVAGYVRGDDPLVGKPKVPVEWVTIAGGSFKMGTDGDGYEFKNAKPVHEVRIKTLQLSKTLITAEQYGECVSKGRCTAPAWIEAPCNWYTPGRKRHPINCLTFNQAQEYADFKGARLPSEAEWEYAATGEGKNQKYPWGNESPSCDLAVMKGCPRGSRGTGPVCSRPLGNAKVSGGELCDMAGNVWQWVQDGYRDSYHYAPRDGSAVYTLEDPSRVVRGGSWDSDSPEIALRADYRNYRSTMAGAYSFASIGFRLARDGQSGYGRE